MAQATTHELLSKGQKNDLVEIRFKTIIPLHFADISSHQCLISSHLISVMYFQMTCLQRNDGLETISTKSFF